MSQITQTSSSAGIPSSSEEIPAYSCGRLFKALSDRPKLKTGIAISVLVALILVGMLAVPGVMGVLGHFGIGSAVMQNIAPFGGAISMTSLGALGNIGALLLFPYLVYLATQNCCKKQEETPQNSTYRTPQYWNKKEDKDVATIEETDKQEIENYLDPEEYGFVKIQDQYHVVDKDKNGKVQWVKAGDSKLFQDNSFESAYKYAERFGGSDYLKQDLKLEESESDEEL